MEFEIQFADMTLLEANGQYAKVCEIMNKEVQKTGARGKNHEWMLRSTITILSPFGFVGMVCHFYHDGKLFIAEYAPSTKDIHNQDIRFLTYWANEFGWKTPEPLPVIVESWLPFWKKEWETFIVDSEHLDKKFGVRQEIQFDKTVDADGDNDDSE